MTALTPCFRSEAGASGKDTRGMIRQHQFQKVELVSIVAPEDERGRTPAKGRMRRGGAAAPGAAVPHHAAVRRRHGVFVAAKTYDLEVWLPSQENVPGDQLDLQLR